MTKEQLNELYTIFEAYTKDFPGASNDDYQNIELKIDHTYRVRDAALDIGASENLNTNELRVAETAALFHDIGRFQQFYKYGTFKDAVSVNHALLGLQEIHAHNMLESVPESEKGIICKAIEYHNKPTVPPNLDTTTDFYVRLLRDADKVDIFKVVTEYYTRQEKETNSTITLELSETPDISDKVLDDFMTGNVIIAEDMVTMHDFKLLQIAWIHDINFNRSMEIIRKHNYLDRIIDTLPEGDKKARVRNKVSHFLEYTATT